jgi:hypothetical protein
MHHLSIPSHILSNSIAVVRRWWLVVTAFFPKEDIALFFCFFARLPLLPLSLHTVISSHTSIQTIVLRLALYIALMNHHTAARQLRPCLHATLTRRTRSLLLPSRPSSSSLIPSFNVKSRINAGLQGPFSTFMRHQSSQSTCAKKSSFEVKKKKSRQAK